MGKTYDEWCKNNKCPHYIEWEYYGCDLRSCELVGQSDHIERIADDCPFRKENKKD